MNLRSCSVPLYLIFASLLFAIFLQPLTALAGTTGKIMGVVRDGSTGEPIAAANVLVQGTPRGAATDLDGQYFIINLMPDTYEIVVSSLGYATKTITGVEVNVDKTTTLNVELDPSAIMGEEVTIVAEKPIIEVDRTFSTASVGAEDLEAMPITRVQEAVNLQAGVVDGHFRGGRSGEVVYLVDGIPVQDAYDNSQATTLNQGAVQELQVISGTFNAEYGQAMSGVVNLITREGGSSYSGQVITRFGDYLSTNDDVFYNIDDISPMAIQDYEGSLSGPVPYTNDKLTFFINGRMDDNSGWYYGQRRWGLEHYTVTDNGSVVRPDLDIGEIFREFPSAFPDDYDTTRAQEVYDAVGVIPIFGDDEPVEMNPDRNLYLYGKLSYQLTDNIKLNYSSLWDDRNYKDYDNDWRYVPEGVLHRFSRGRTNMLRATWALSQRAFIETGYSNTFKEYYHYTFEDPFDDRYVSSFFSDLSPGVTLKMGGTNNEHFRRFTDSHNGTTKLNWQVNNVHYVVAGVSTNFNTIYYDQFTLSSLDPKDETSSDFFIRDPSALDHDEYFNNPFEGAVYVQDKIEFKNFIVNAGVRLDYFDPDAKILADPADPNIYSPLLESHANDPLTTRHTYWWKDASAKYQVSPRLGVAYPISPTGVLHFAYGHFFQRPRYEYLYTNPEWELDPNSSTGTLMGNPDLEAEKTISYEFGLQQGITDDMSMGLSLYQRDIRNLVSSDRIVSTYDAGTKYIQYTNRDFGEVKGIVLSLDKRYANGFSGQLNYTYQIAEGNASDPQDAFNAQKAEQQPIKQLLPLDWDRRHTINATVNYFQPKIWGASLIAYYGSGLPYTSKNLSTEADVEISFENDARKPDYFNVDLNAFYYLPWFEGTGITASVELMVRNLFDRLNENDVFTDTGRATYTQEYYQNLPSEEPSINTLDEVYNRPQYYSRPREVRIGFKFSF